MLGHRASLWADPEKASCSLHGKGPHGGERDSREGSQEVLGVLVQSSISGSALGAVDAALLKLRNGGRLGGRGHGGLFERLRRGCGL